MIWTIHGSPTYNWVELGILVSTWSSRKTCCSLVFSRCFIGTSSVLNRVLSVACFFISISVAGKLRSVITTVFSLIHVCSMVASSRYSLVFICESYHFHLLLIMCSNANLLQTLIILTILSTRAKLDKNKFFFFNLRANWSLSLFTFWTKLVILKN